MTYDAEAEVDTLATSVFDGRHGASPLPATDTQGLVNGIDGGHRAVSLVGRSTLWKVEGWKGSEKGNKQGTTITGDWGLTGPARSEETEGDYSLLKSKRKVFHHGGQHEKIDRSCSCSAINTAER